jgi:hypothetical protein
VWSETEPLSLSLTLGWFWSALLCISMRATSNGWFQHAMVPPMMPDMASSPLLSFAVLLLYRLSFICSQPQAAPFQSNRIGMRDFI